MIILATLNARYIHASLGLRYLLANMGNLKSQTVLREFTISQPPQDVVNELLNTLNNANDINLPIIGFGVYIWNVVPTLAVIRSLKTERPEIKIVLGGPEVSHEVDEQEIIRLADYVITGWGELSFAQLCQRLLQDSAPTNKIIVGEHAPLEKLILPYAEYTADDLAHRLLYVEASRGCPYQCHFCLSSLDKTAWAFPLDPFLAEMDKLYQRGARQFKFVDRTFNLKIEASIRILQFFLDRINEEDNDLFLHFEVIPDHLPDRLKLSIAQFPPGILQFEVGIQSFNPEVQRRIARKQDNEKTENNLRWLLTESHAHLHADLIFALPGESFQSFADGFDRLYAMQLHEIQLGILKRLRGTPIAQHTVAFGMVYDTAPPYTIQQTADIDRETLQRFTRFARYWELIANSGRFNATTPLLLKGGGTECKLASPFYAFLAFSDWFWAKTGKTYKLTPEFLVDTLSDYLIDERRVAPNIVQKALLSDYLASGARGMPVTLKDVLLKRSPPTRLSQTPSLTRRQDRHLASPKKE
jgi:radical SAM superfamily enzyme YgiQ (UPF0313 family)